MGSSVEWFLVSVGVFGRSSKTVGRDKESRNTMCEGQREERVLDEEQGMA